MTADTEINALKPESPMEAADGSFIIVNGGDPKELELDVGERLDRNPVSASVNGLRGDLEEKEGDIHEVHGNGVECDGVGEKKEAEDGKLGSVVDVEVDQRPNALAVAEEIRDPKEEELDNAAAPENREAKAEGVIEVVAGKEQGESVHETFTAVKVYKEEAESAPTKKEEEKIDGEEALGPNVQLQEEKIEKDVLLKIEEVKPDGSREIDEAESGESHRVMVTQTETETKSEESNYFVVSKIDEEAKLEESHEIEVQLEENHQVVVTKADDDSRSEEISEVNQDHHAGSGTAADENIVAGSGNDEAADENIVAGSGNDEAADENIVAGPGNVEAADENIVAVSGNDEAADENIVAVSGNDEAADENIVAGSCNDEVEVMKDRAFDESKPVEIDATQESEDSQNQAKLESEVKVEGSSEADVVEVEVMNPGVFVVSESTNSEFMTVENEEAVPSDVALAVQKSEAFGEQDDIPAQLQKDGRFVDFDTSNHGSQDEASPENVDVADVACTYASPGRNGIQADENQMGEALPENVVNESQTEVSHENGVDGVPTDKALHKNGVDEVRTADALHEDDATEVQTDEALHENGLAEVQTEEALHEHDAVVIQTVEALHKNGATEVQTDEALHENGLAEVQTEEALHEHDAVIQTVEALHKNGAAEVQIDEALHENGLAEVQTDEALHEHDAVVIQTVEALHKNGAAEVQTGEALHENGLTEVQTDEALHKNGAAEVQTVEALHKNGAAEVQTVEALHKNGAAEVQTDEALKGNDVVEVQTVDTVHESGVEQSSRDDNLAENDVATEGRIDTALEAGSKNSEDGDVTLLADGKQVDLIAGNSSEVGTSTDIDEPAPYNLTDELSGSSDEVDPTASKEDDGKPNSEEIEVIKGTESSPKEEACSSVLDGERSLKQRTYWLIKVPWIHDAEKAAQVKNARCQLEELTKARDEVKAATRVQREKFKESYELLEDAKIKEKAARNALAAKRKEIDSVQSVLEKMKNATSIDNICDQIQTMERMIEHETMPLSQEKQYLNEIKRLKLRKEQLFSNMGPQADIQEAFDQKDQIENRAKILKKELEALRTEVMQAENTRKTALKRSNDERLRLIDLIEKQRLAYVHREEAYELFSKLNKENQHHTEYMVDKKAADSFVACRDVERLGCHCDDQIEKVMKLWNADDKFRKQYVESNMKSLWRRFKTLDGRSLGPGEEPHVLPSSEVKRSGNVSLLLTKDGTSVQVSAPESEQENVGVVKVPEKDSSSFPELVQINQSAVPRNATKSIPRATTVIASNNEETEDGKGVITETKEEEEKRKKAEELAKKEEELRKEKLEIELKEQHRLEQRAKAKEAEERKRRQVEKAQARAELKAQKEAELREKKRAKKVKKKAAETTNGSVEGASDPMESTAPETTQEPETAVTTNSRRSSRPLISAKKYNKVQPVPLPLRKKGKRKMQTWMWVALVSLLILAIFFTGDYLPSLKFSFPSLGF